MCDRSFEQLWMLESNGKLSKVSSSIIVDTLDKLVDFVNQNGPIQSMDYHAEKIFRYLYSECDSGRISANEVLQIEIRYVKLLENPKLLNEALSSDPELFVGFLKLMYKSKDEPALDVPVSEELKRKAENAYEIISKFKTIPGSKPDGTIDSTALSDYFRNAMAQLRECGRFKKGSQKL